MKVSLTQTNDIENTEQIVEIREPKPRNREERRKQAKEQKKRNKKYYSIKSPYIDWGKVCDYFIER